VFRAIRDLCFHSASIVAGAQPGLSEKLGFLRIWLGPNVARQECRQFGTLFLMWRARCPVVMANQPVDIDWVQRSASRSNADPRARS
jgi:hypothetical protein